MSVEFIAYHRRDGMPGAQYGAFQVCVEDRYDVLLAYHVVARICNDIEPIYDIGEQVRTLDLAFPNNDMIRNKCNGISRYLGLVPYLYLLIFLDAENKQRPR